MCSIVYEKTGSVTDTFYYVTLVQLVSVFLGYLFLAIRYRLNLNLYSSDMEIGERKEKTQNYNPLNMFKFRAEFFYTQLVQLFGCGIIFTFSTISAGMFQSVFG